MTAKVCSRCGRKKSIDDFARDCRAVVMDFDHVRGQKVAGISQMWSWGREKVLIELAKCELVCANCHRLRTQTRRNDVRRAA